LTEKIDVVMTTVLVTLT